MSNNTPLAAAPTIKRRLISIVYEILLGLAVVFLPLLVFEIATKGGHTPAVEHMRQALVFLVLGAYFIHQWSRQGQTLAMKTWRLKVVHPGHSHLSLQAAAVRYLLAWMWVLPGALVAYALGPPGATKDAGPGTDFYAVAQGQTSVTPLQIDLTHKTQLDVLAKALA